MQNLIIIVSIIAAWKYNKLIELNELFFLQRCEHDPESLEFL